MKDSEEFYIGWQSRAPVGIGSHIRKTVTGLSLAVLVVAFLLPLGQRTIGLAVFEWGTVKDFSGTLQSRPYPHLLVQRPGKGAGWSAYYLVAPFKFGLQDGMIQALEGKQVTLKGTLIYRANQTMIEVQPESINVVSAGSMREMGVNMINLGSQTLIGEIVDSKCYLGVMNPGRLTPHRGCAVRCISGGIPPVLLVRPETGPPLYFLLVSKDGRPINKQVLDMVAEPIQITGEVLRQGDLSILRADPSTYKRVQR
jgi:hypothetical protein